MKENKNSNLLSTGLGKIMPNDIETENALIGLLMTDPDSLAVVSSMMKEETFYLEKNKLIYSAIKDIALDGISINVITVTQRLKKKGQLDMVGGAYEVTKMASGLYSAEDADIFAKKLVEKEIARNIIFHSGAIYSEAFLDETDPFDLISKMEGFLQSIGDRMVAGKSMKSLSELLKTIIKDHDIASQERGVIGVPSSLHGTNYYLGGYQPSDSIICAARPGMGKTAFAIGEAVFAAKTGVPVAVFSLEMSAKQIALRIAAAESELDSKKIQKGRLLNAEITQLTHRLGKINHLPIWIDDTPSLSIVDMRARARRMKNRYGIGFIVVDYLQLIRGDVGKSGTRDQEIGQVSAGLKAMAKELDVPVLALAQLGRSAEKRGKGESPVLSDLRESGSIEQDADVVMFIFRPEYYGINEDESGNSTINKASFIIAKNRNGSLGDFVTGFIKEQTKFENIQE